MDNHVGTLLDFGPVLDARFEPIGEEISFPAIFDDEFQPTDIAATISLDQLVANAGSSDMLEDEPEAASMLAGFRSRLLKSLEFVEKAIASLPKP